MKTTATSTAKKAKPTAAKATVGKAALAKAKEKEKELAASQIPVINPEMDEDEDMDEAAGSSGGAGPSFGKEESSSHTPKNFRNHPDMENFFRFIYENDLRVEALQILDGIIAEQGAAAQK